MGQCVAVADPALRKQLLRLEGGRRAIGFEDDFFYALSLEYGDPVQRAGQNGEILFSRNGQGAALPGLGVGNVPPVGIRNTEQRFCAGSLRGFPGGGVRDDKLKFEGNGLVLAQPQYAFDGVAAGAEGA